ncbi:MAG: hypothetical protein ACYTHM_17415 [Planctomycetota bacterium]
MSQSRIEQLLFTVYNKRRTEHFILETSYDMGLCMDFIAFCETQYREFLRWCGKPEGTQLWPYRVRVVIINNKAEWDCLMRAMNRGEPSHILEKRKELGGSWNVRQIVQYSREGSTPDHDKLHLFHMLNHLFLHGLAKSGHEGRIWWLWESFAWYRAIEIFGAKGSGCGNYETGALTDEERAWNDLDDWVILLKRDVRTKMDEDFTRFWQRDLTRIKYKNLVKGWSLIRFFCRDQGSKARFIRFLELLKTKNDQERAFIQAFAFEEGRDGETVGAWIDRQWRNWILRQPTRWRTR